VYSKSILEWALLLSKTKVNSIIKVFILRLLIPLKISNTFLLKYITTLPNA
jgi:hypothetical protein